MTAPALTLHRARAGAPFATKGALATALGWWREGAGCEGEWLLVPRLRLIAPSPAQSTPTALARQLDRALDAVRAAATVDPAPGTWPTGALRFTRRERWLAWLAVRLASSEAAGPAECAPLPETPAVMKAQLRELLVRDPLVLPALVRCLIAAGEFGTWVGGWNRADLGAIETALTAHYGMPPAVVSALTSAPHQPPVPGSQSLQVSAAMTPVSRNQLPAARTAGRLVATLSDSPALATLDPPHRAVAIVLAAIAKAPALAPQIAAQLILEARADRSTEPAPDLVRTGASQRSVQPARFRPMARPIPPRRVRKPARPTDHSALHYPRPRPAKREHDLLVEEAIAPFSQHPYARPRQTQPQSAPVTLAPDVHCETQFGGLLFLLNAFTALGLYPDFTRPLDPRIEPSPCWLLEQIGMAWFGRHFARDPLRAWLAERAVAGQLPDLWQVDPAWEAPASRLVRFRLGRLACCWDRRGFLAQVQKLRPRGGRLPDPPLKVDRALRRLPLQAKPWLGGLLSYLDWRLGEAGVRRRDLCLPGELLLGEDEATLRFPLAQLPLALRMAGLDRNPGWLPAEGCNFRFEFT